MVIPQVVALFRSNRLGFKGRQTPHGFRGFGQTNSIEPLKVPKIVTEKQWAHSDAHSDARSVSRAYGWAVYLDERADAEHRAILAAALLSPPRRNLAELLAAMPDVGSDGDFQRPNEPAAAPDVFG